MAWHSSVEGSGTRMTYGLYLAHHQHTLPLSSGFLRSSDLTIQWNAGLVFSQLSESRPWWSGTSPTILCMEKQTPGRSNSKRYLCWDLCCPLQNQWCSPISGSFQFQKLSQWAKMTHRAFIYVTNVCSFHLCNKWGCGFKTVMHWPSPTPTAIYGRAPIDASGSRIRVVGNYFENRMEKISEPHLLSLFPLSSHIHTLLLVSLAVVKWCTNWFCMDKITLREMCYHNLI